MRCPATVFASITASVTAVVSAAVLAVGLLAEPAAASTVQAAPAAVPGRVSVAALRATGARTDVTVVRLRRSAQARWVDHVVDERLVSLDGCLADTAGYSFRRGTYRSHVNTLCAGGVAQARRAASALVAGRPWYRVRVRAVPVVAFTFTTGLQSGRGNPVDAAFSRLPHGDFTYLEGDDTSMAYVGQHVTQAQLDAARAAFAAELQIPVAQVSVARLVL